MAIILNDNIRINAGKPSESKYLSSTNLPYSGSTLSAALSAVTTAISISERYLGLTVLVTTGGSNIEYWFKEGVQNANLIEKKFTSEQLVGDFITGATNLGYFSGTTGIQWLDISGSGFGSDVGAYFSEYNWYYVDGDGNIRIGAPTYNGPFRRGYVTAVRDKSWVWNVSTAQWEISLNDIAANVGAAAIISPHTGYVFTGATFSGSEGTASASTTAYGSLTTGNTLTIGYPIYKDKSDQDLHFRTIINDTPEFLKVQTDENFIHFSGVSSVITGTNYGGGIGVFSGKTGSNLKFRTLIASGDTSIIQKTNGQLIVYSSSEGSANAITGATNIGTGTTVYSGITNRNLYFNTFVGSGSTSISKIGNEIRIFSCTTGDACYDLASPSAIPVGGICTGTVLTGKTAFQLFEELLVPELCGIITEPNITSVGLTHSGLYEIDCNISQTLAINFSRGCINPQYCSISDKRSGTPNAYCFCGPEDMPIGFQSCTALSASATDASYDVVIGTQTWGGCVRYNVGSPALSNKGNQYCAALGSGCTSTSNNSIIGVYPLYATTSTITPPLTQQILQNMSTANNVLISLVTESGGNKQKFQIPCAWLGAPTNKPLVGVCQWNTVSSQWEYPGGSAGTSLALWTTSSATETVQGNSVGYCQYTHNGVDRSAVCIRLVF